MVFSSISLTLVMLSVVASAAGLTVAVRSWAVRHNALVQPSERCSHTIPTPHGGGIAIAAISMVLGVLFSVLDWVPDSSMLAFMSLGLAMVILGVWDDFGDVSPKLRLFVHFAVVAVGMWSIPRLPVLSIFGTSVDTSALVMLWPLLMVGWVWLINLYNFMDGIDGLAAAQGILVFLGMAIIFFTFGFPKWGWICLLFLGAVLGFLILNWPPAKIFMGDGGSSFLGFSLGFLMLLSASETKVSMWSWLILLLPFIADATTTLLVRFVTGQRVLEAHNLHAYQKLARKFSAHAPVTLIYSGIVVFTCFPMAYIANLYPHSGLYLFGFGFAALSAASFVVGAGTPKHYDIQ